MGFYLLSGGQRARTIIRIIVVAFIHVDPPNGDGVLAGGVANGFYVQRLARRQLLHACMHTYIHT